MARRNALLFPSVITLIVGATYLAMAAHSYGAADPRQAEASPFRFIIAGALIAASIAVFVIGRRLSSLERSPPGGRQSDLEHLQRLQNHDRLNRVLWEESGINPKNSGRALDILGNPDDKFPIG